MRLQDKFKKVFILPLICGILISIILTVIILILYANQFADDDLVKRLQSVENDKTLPIIQTTKNMLYKKFNLNQQPIHPLLARLLLLKLLMATKALFILGL